MYRFKTGNYSIMIYFRFYPNYCSIIWCCTSQVGLKCQLKLSCDKITSTLPRCWTNTKSFQRTKWGWVSHFVNFFQCLWCIQHTNLMCWKWNGPSKWVAKKVKKPSMCHLQMERTGGKGSSTQWFLESFLRKEKCLLWNILATNLDIPSCQIRCFHV